MIREFQAFLTVFCQGKQLANSTSWKNRAIAANAITALLGAAVIIAGGFGYEIHLDSADAEAIGLGVATLFALGNTILHVITSARVGLPAKPDAADSYPALDR